MSISTRVSKSFVGQKEIEAVSGVLERGFLGMGAETQAFETELAQYLGGGVEVVCTSTGTAAIQLALQACGIGPGDEVLVPSLTYVATFQAIAACGGTPVACDVSAETGLLDLGDAERKLTGSTRVLLPVHYASAVGDIASMYTFAGRHGLRVIEDAAHAFGCQHEGRIIGSFGDVVCFSFDGIKNITAGEGGAVVTHDRLVAQSVRDARLLGVERDTEKRYAGQRSWDFDVKIQGWRYHMSDIMAAIGRAQLRRFDSEMKPARICLAKAYRDALDGMIGIVLFSNEPGMVPHIFPIRILGGRRDAVRAALAEHGIETGIHYKPNHLLSMFRAQGVRLPVVEQIYPELLTLPLHPWVSEKDVGQVVNIIKETIK